MQKGLAGRFRKTISEIRERTVSLGFKPELSMRLSRLFVTVMALTIAAATLRAEVAGGSHNPARDTLQTAADTSYNYGISLRTNLLWWGAAEPNLSIDIPLSDHFSLNASGGFKSWPRFAPWDTDIVNDTRHWRNFAVVPGARYWFDETYSGLFVGVDLLYTHFNVGNVKFPLGLYPEVRDERLQGDFWGAGINTGYSWWIANQWRFEVEAGVAAGYVNATRYPCSHCGNELGKRKGPGVVPKLGVNIAWNPNGQRPEPVPEPEPVVIPEPPQVVPDPGTFVIGLPEVEDYMGKAGDLLPHHPVLRPTSEYTPYTPDRILRKEEGALYVFFELAKSDLKRTFTEGGSTRDNGPVLDEIMDITSQIMADTTSRVSTIQIIGLASVEGSLQNNQRLSHARANALKKYIQDRLSIDDSLFELVAGGEAWTELRDQVSDLIAEGGNESLSVEDLQKVLDVIDGTADWNERERRLKALSGGRIYKVLLSTVLQEQRNSGYIRIYFDYVPDEGARAINDAISVFENGNVESALEKLEGLRGDSRSDQAYAAALLKSGREAEAVEVLEAAVERGDEGCKALLADWKAFAAKRAAREEYLQQKAEYDS